MVPPRSDTMAQTAQKVGGDAAGTRGRIMTATVALMLELPFDDISMEMVAKSAGVSRRTVFNHFATKELLLTESVQKVWSSIGISEIANASDALRDPVATMTRIGDAAASFWLRPDSVAVARMVIRESAKHPEMTEHYVELGKRPVTRSIIQYLERLSQQGSIDIADHDLAAKQFLGLMIEPLVLLRILGLQETHTPEYAAKVVREAVHMFFLRYPLASEKRAH